MKSINLTILMLNLACLLSNPLFGFEKTSGDNWDKFVLNSAKDFDVSYGFEANGGIESGMSGYIRQDEMLSSKPIVITGSGKVEVFVDFKVDGFVTLKGNNDLSRKPLFSVTVEFNDGFSQDFYETLLIGIGHSYLKYNFFEVAKSDDWTIYDISSKSMVHQQLNGIEFDGPIQNFKVSIENIFENLNITINNITIRVLKDS